ncbi:MAG TPA: hypothetical protein VLE19_15240 [Pyrinomonadaceae bacterium]|nr:hypothetical protein [Pyrinomonadaceae bacterium]
MFLATHPILVGFVSLLLACPQTSVIQKPRLAQIDPNKFAVIINGASGEEEYSKQFEQWTKDLSTALTQRYGFDSAKLRVLTENPRETGAPRSTAEEVKRTFTLLKSELQTNNVVFVFFIGHGSFDGKESKFNLVGPDLPSSEYNSLLTSLPTRRIIVINMSSASGEFARSLSRQGRIVITATRNGQETNATHFPGFFIDALNATDSDTDQDGHVSVLEAFVYASRLTAEFYTRAGRLATEHALLEDNGDGVGHERVEAGEGLLSRATYLDSLSIEQAAENVAIAKLLRERTRLEGEIEQLISRKANLQEAEYEANLERLFIELAKVNRSIKQAGT